VIRKFSVSLRINELDAKKIKVALGIMTRKVLTGPVEVSVDLTRKCGLDCLMCWWWSPLLKEHPSREWANQKIDFELFKELIKDFKKLNVKRIVLGGQGDPLLYPEILEAIEITKKTGIGVSLITSGAYFGENRIRKIFDLGVDNIDISLQAATPSTYVKIHPGQNEGTFERIKKELLLLQELKEKYHRKIPRIQIIFVLCALNYQEVASVVELAREVRAESVGFKRIDVIPETKGLLLTSEQLKELKSLLKEAKEEATKSRIATSLDFYQKFIEEGLTTGVYTSTYYTLIPCYVGWLSSRILSDGNVIPCCGCYDVVFGNIRDTSFAAIWNSVQYQQFRKQSINIWKNPNLVQKCKCSSCIDFEFNLGIYRRLHPLKAERIQP
jgi:radical SAM protein with 4Fe4S-binding SPASM domain